MERFTKKIDDVVLYIGPGVQYPDTGDTPAEMRPQEIRTALARLADYEDANISPELAQAAADFFRGISREQIKNLEKLAEAAEGKRLLLLPCAIGSTVYMHSPLCWENGHATFEGCKFSQDCTHWRGFKCPLKVVERTFNVTMYKRVGQTYWLTPEEAEAAIPADQRYRP